jgi:predicted alpha-1,6-mannanase (GH76 family)
MHLRHLSRTLAVVAAAGLVALPAVTAPPPAAAHTADQATQAFEDFLDVYWDADAEYFFTYSDHQIHPEHAHGPLGGLYTDYWWEAQLWEMVMDRYERTGDPTARAMIDQVYDGFLAQYPDVLDNDWNDDIGWWARASIRAYELTGEQRYADAAELMFTYIAGYEDDTYGGGIWWKNVDVGDGTRNEKNVATNASAVITAMGLYRLTGDPTYRATAQRLYDWVATTFDHDGHLADHVAGDGDVVSWDWTYNQGNFAAASLALYLDADDPAYLDAATRAVDWAIDDLTSSGTFLHEGRDDTGGFKAILTRAIRDLIDDAGLVRYEQVLTDNATMAADQVNSSGIGGYDWTAPTPELSDEAIQSISAAATVAVLQQAVPDGDAGPTSGTGVYQAENADHDGMGTEASGTGYTGRGYLAGWIADGSSVTFHVNLAAGGTYPLTLRYSAAAGDAVRTLAVEGGPTTVTFPATGGWDDWAEVTVPVDLPVGHSAVVLTLDAGAGGTGYLDRMDVPLG